MKNIIISAIIFTSITSSADVCIVSLTQNATKIKVSCGDKTNNLLINPESAYPFEQNFAEILSRLTYSGYKIVSQDSSNYTLTNR